MSNHSSWYIKISYMFSTTTEAVISILKPASDMTWYTYGSYGFCNIFQWLLIIWFRDTFENCKSNLFRDIIIQETSSFTMHWSLWSFWLWKVHLREAMVVAYSRLKGPTDPRFFLTYVLLAHTEFFLPIDVHITKQKKRAQTSYQLSLCYVRTILKGEYITFAIRQSKKIWLRVIL